MAQTETLEMSDQERRAWDRRAATMAARLMRCCLGIEAEPAFDVTNPNGAGTARVKGEPYGIGLFKDAFDFRACAEVPELQVLIVDEKGLTKAESKELFSLGQVLDLLAKLPLPVAPRAAQWLKDALGEAGPAAARDGSLGKLGLKLEEKREVVPCPRAP